MQTLSANRRVGRAVAKKQRTNKKQHMNCNRWTLALLGAGLVSLPAVTQAEEQPNSVLTALLRHDPERLCGHLGSMEFWHRQWQHP